MNARTIDTVVIGGGQAGLAMSALLGERGVDHLVLERGRVGERWRSERWDSLRTLTPNWMTNLPGSPYQDGDPEGFMSKDQVVELLESYARANAAPVMEGVTVRDVRPAGDGLAVTTGRETIHARNVVVATGQAGRPVVPDSAGRLDGSIDQLHSSSYRNPEQLREGGVLVVGAGASGIQIAAELQAAGRPVTLAVGRHARAVRRYRGRDIWWWLEAMGVLDVTADEVADLDRARRTPSLGLSGSSKTADVDLGLLAEQGVRLTGRLIDGWGTTLRFAADLAGSAAEADRRLIRLLDRIDQFIRESGIDTPPADRPAPVRIGTTPRELDLAAEGITTVIWCTGYRPGMDFVSADVFDRSGSPVHRRGVTSVPGLYFLGLRFQWRRSSHFLGGVGHDAAFLADHIAARRPAVPALAAV